MRREHVLKRGHLGQEVIELEDKPERAVAEGVAATIAEVVDPFSFHLDLPAFGGVQEAEQVQERALARTARADDRQEFAVFDLHIDASQHRDGVPTFTIALFQAAHGEFRHRIDLSRIVTNQRPTTSFESKRLDRMELGRAALGDHARADGDQKRRRRSKRW